MTIYQFVHTHDTLNLSITFCLHSSVCLVHILISSLVLPQPTQNSSPDPLRLASLHTFRHGDFTFRFFSLSWTPTHQSVSSVPVSLQYVLTLSFVLYVARLQLRFRIPSTRHHYGFLYNSSSCSHFYFVVFFLVSSYA